MSPSVPGSGCLPCLCSPCRPVEEWEHKGCPPCFWRSVWFPTNGAGISLFSWSPARWPWEKQVLFHGKVLQGEIPAQPGQPHISPGPWCSGVSPMLWGRAGCTASGVGR